MLLRPAILAMVGALLLLSAGSALNGDFAGTMPYHSHVYLGAPQGPHSHEFSPGGTSSGDVVNAAPNEAGTVALAVVTAPTTQSFGISDAAPWTQVGNDDQQFPDGLITPPPDRPPIS